jgi:subtilisin family serine protease
MDKPPALRSWDTSDVALVAAIAAESGHAVVAFKEPASSHSLQTGLRAGVSSQTVTAGLDALRAAGAVVIDFYDAIGAAHVRMDPASAPALRANTIVDYVEPRQWRRTQGIPGANILAFLGLGTPQTIPWGIQLVRASDAWSTTRGAGAKIYLIDTGHNQGHEDLPLVPTANCGGAYGGCDDAYPIPHGTHVLGIWTARDNTVGVEGVAPAVAPDHVYVWGACSSDTGECSTTEIINGLNAAIFDAGVVNMSLAGTAYDAGEANAVAQDWNYNIVLVAAAGNVINGVVQGSAGSPPGTVVYPANYTNVIGVAGVQPDKSFASTSPCVLPDGSHPSSNYGPHVDLAAPFWALSTVPGGYDDETGGWCGTSMATPHVSGVAALVRAENPTWTNQQIVDQLFGTAEDLGAPGWDDHFGHGLVNAAAAVAPPVPPVSVSIDGPTDITQAGSYTWTALPTGGTGTYSYDWEYRDALDPNTWKFAGAGTSVSKYVDASTANWFVYKVTVTSSYQSGQASVTVQNELGTCNPYCSPQP